MRRVLDWHEETAISTEMTEQGVVYCKYVDECVVFDRARYYLERGLIQNVRDAVKAGRAYERNVRQQKARRSRNNDRVFL